SSEPCRLAGIRHAQGGFVRGWADAAERLGLACLPQRRREKAYFIDGGFPLADRLWQLCFCGLSRAPRVLEGDGGARRHIRIAISGLHLSSGYAWRRSDSSSCARRQYGSGLASSRFGNPPNQDYKDGFDRSALDSATGVSAHDMYGDRLCGLYEL